MYQPLNDRVPVVNPDGTPTQYLIRLLQERGITVDGKITAEQAAEIAQEVVGDWSQGRDINAAAPLTGGGPLSSDVTIGHDVSGVTPGSYTNANITVDDRGHVTAAANGSGGGGGGGVTLLETLSPSGVSSINSEAWAGGSYKRLLFNIRATFSSDGANLTVRSKLNGSYKSGSNYRYALSNQSSSGATNAETSQTATAMTLSGVGGTWGVGNATLEHYTGSLTVIAPFDTTKPKTFLVDGEYGAPSGAYVSTRGGGVYDGTDAASALEGIQFNVSSGTFTGEIEVYGFAA